MKLCTVYPQEINEGRRVGRAELYCVTHTNKKGKPVDDYSASKIDEIQNRLKANPSLIGEEAHEGDLYSSIFPRTSRTHGLGLIVGGKGKLLDQVVAALQESKEENRELRRVVDNLQAKSERMEEQCNEMRAFFLTFQEQGHQPGQQEGTNLEHVSKVKDVSEKNLSSQQQPGNQNTSHEPVAKKQQAMAKDLPTTNQVFDSHILNGEVTASKMKRSYKQIQSEAEIIKCGMEVGLTSPNSAQVVALGTI